MERKTDQGLVGQRVLVVGGTSGVGLAVAEAALARGAAVVVASRREASAERAVLALGSRATGGVVDVQDDASIASLLESAGPIDHLVYTAGEPLEQLLLPELTSVRIRTFLETRFVGALAVIRAVVGSGAIRADGSVVLTSGTAGHRPGTGWALGASVCGAVEALTRQLAVELAPIRVNAVVPGVTRTPLWSALDDAERAAMFDAVGASLPLGRVAEARDVALAYVHAMEQRMSTGTAFVVDGGALLA